MKHIILAITVSVLVFMGGLISCNKNKNRDEAIKMINEWKGKKILFPEKYGCNLFGKNTISTVCSTLFNAEYKVLLYVDSTGCISCRLRLDLWKQLIEESDTLFQNKLCFLFFFQPKNTNDVANLLKTSHFSYPILIDTANHIERLNHFPLKEAYRCFLVDKDNKVLMIGNPALNPKIWELYKEHITGEKSAKNEPQTVAKMDKTVHNYGVIKKGSKNKVVFTITNKGSKPLIITRVTASCGCTNVDWDKQPIRPGAMATISAEITPDETGAFNKTIDVFGNFAGSPIKLTLTGLVE